MGTPIEPQDDVQGITEPEPDNSPGPNPAWNDVLGVIPEQFHSVITPHFQKWDQAAQSQIEKANQAASQYEPYKAFIEHGIDATELENGLRLMYEVNNNPQAVWNALGQAYSLANDPGKAAENDDDEESPEGNVQQILQDNPKLAELQQGIELVSQIVLNEQTEKANAKADAELEAELAALKKTHGEYDENYVMGLMLNGTSAEDAVQSFVDLRNNLLQNNPRPFAPHVMGSSGGGSGIPSQAIDPTKLSGKDTRNLVAQMLQAEFGPQK